MLEVKKREGETAGSFLFRFTKKVKRSGVLKEVRKRRFRGREKNKGKRRAGALYRLKRKQEFEEERKYGYGFGKKNTK